MPELFVNDPGTTLNGTINSSVTTLVVASSSGYPSTGNFRIRIDSEIMLVTAVSGTTWTVTRGVEGTTAAGHTTGVSVAHVVTGGALTTATPAFDAVTAYATANNTHTTNNTWEDVGSMTVTFTPVRVTNAIALGQVVIVPTSSNWEHVWFRLLVDGVATDALWKTEKSGNPDGGRVMTASFHHFMSSLSAASHTVKMQWIDNGSSLDVNLQIRRLTVFSV